MNLSLETLVQNNLLKQACLVTVLNLEIFYFIRLAFIYNLVVVFFIYVLYLF